MFITCPGRTAATTTARLAGSTGQRLRRQLLGSVRKGGRGHPGPGARLCLRGRSGPGPQEAGAIVRPEPGTAPPEAPCEEPRSCTSNKGNGANTSRKSRKKWTYLSMYNAYKYP
uniref:Uncharacterized protein n=1 Tax=Marmota marmota marmota TaxID=9994 RepID=A0A8C6EQS1_MARMA